MNYDAVPITKIRIEMAKDANIHYLLRPKGRSMNPPQNIGIPWPFKCSEIKKTIQINLFVHRVQNCLLLVAILAMHMHASYFVGFVWILIDFDSESERVCIALTHAQFPNVQTSHISARKQAR